MTGLGQRGASNATKEILVLREKELTLRLAVRCSPIERPIALASVDSQIRDFVAGRTDGEALLHALYDHVLDEPVPQSLRVVLRG